jgi:signal transduction histidine kinase
MSKVRRASPSALAEIAKYRDLLASADTILRGVADGVTIQDAVGRLLYVNDVGARLCGFPDAATMLATPSHEIVERFEMLDEHGAPVLAEQLPGRRVLTGDGPARMLIRVRHRQTGVTFWATIRAHAILDDDGAPELAINVWNDATAEHKQREGAKFLAEATARLATSIDYTETLKAVAQTLVPELADWCGVDLVEDGVSRSLAVAHADPAKVQMAHEFREKYPPDPDTPGGVPNVIRTGIPELYADIPPELLRTGAKDEEHFAAMMALGLRSLMIVPIMVSGKPEGALTLASSESGRLYDTSDLALACEIGRRAGTAIENARAFRSAKSAVRARDEFLAVAGHELRTPLAALMLQIESLKLAMQTGALAREPDRFAQRIDRTFGHALRIARLVDGLLDVSRIADSHLELQLEEVDLSTLVRDTCERFAEDATRAGCALTVIAPSPCVGRWDPPRIEQVVSNLLSNAMKYAPNAPIVVRCECRDDLVVLEIEDRGIGIAEEDRERVFGRFERAVSERNYPGLGLGLWITRELVSAHGGTITVKSEMARGSTFTVTLPRITIPSHA